MRLFEGTEFDIPPRCDRCNELVDECGCPALPDPLPARIPPEKQTAKVFTQKRKHGRIITCIKDLDSQDCPEVLTKLKNAFGSGGTVRDGVIEIQGDHADAARDTLKKLGYKVR